MATKTIGASGKDYTTVAGWSAYVKALVTLTENEIGEMTDDAVYAWGATTDLGFQTAITFAGYTITLKATTNKHDGDFGSGSRIEGLGADYGGMYVANSDAVGDFTLEDITFYNTRNTGGGGTCFQNTRFTVWKRCLLDGAASTSGARIVTNSGGACTIEACRTLGGDRGIRIRHADDIISNCSILDATNGITSTDSTHAGTIKNTLAYNCTTDWSGTFSGTYSHNASEDGTHPGTSGVTISGDPFDADGYTPASSGQLDGAGVDLSISLDAANNSFNATPSIGAYEIIAIGATIITVTAGTWPAWSGKNLTVIANVIVTVTAGNINWLGQALAAKADTLINITAGVFNWLGQNLQPFTNAIRIITAGVFNWLGQALATSNNTIHIIIAGVFNWLGQNLTVVQVTEDLEQAVNDEKLNKLETALAKIGHISDLEVEWLQSLHVSVTSDNINTAWDQYFDSQSIPAGQRNDRAYAWLGGLGYTGTISKRWLDFWSAP